MTRTVLFIASNDQILSLCSLKFYSAFEINLHQASPNQIPFIGPKTP